MTTENTIRELAIAHLADDHHVRGVEFIDQLLQVVVSTGQITCTMAKDRGIRFQIPNQPAWEIDLGRARSKLRMLCARLGVLCNESGDAEVSLYGGEGIIRGLTSPSPLIPSSDNAVFQGSGPSRLHALDHPPRGQQTLWSVRFKNTPSEQEFTIVAE